MSHNVEENLSYLLNMDETNAHGVLCHKIG